MPFLMKYTCKLYVVALLISLLASFSLAALEVKLIETSPASPYAQQVSVGNPLSYADSSFDLLTLFLFLSVPGYLLLQIYTLAAYKGKWKNLLFFLCS